MSQKQSVTVSFPLGTLLTVLFIALKLTGNITWSWWWVLSPTLIPIGIVLSIVLIAFFVAVLK